MARSLFLIMIAVVMSATAFGQPRPPERTAERAAARKPAPANVPAKYEGGMYGFSQKVIGTLRFDDVNERLVFFGEDQKELFGLPYDSFLVIYPQSKSVTSTTGSVVSHIPVPGAVLGDFIKEKRRYLIVQFDDPDVDAKGVVNFKIDDKEVLDLIIQTLADKAGLQPRGDAYYKPKSAKVIN
jgi:hypothetical protein